MNLTNNQTAGESRLRWSRDDRLFTGVSWQGQPLTAREATINAHCRFGDQSAFGVMRLDAKQSSLACNSLEIELQHELYDSGAGLGEDLLEAALTIRNLSEESQSAELVFCIAFRPSPEMEWPRAFIPINVAGLAQDRRFDDFGIEHMLQDCDQYVQANGFEAHYLEPMASYPDQRESKALLLAPVVDLYDPNLALRLGLFTSSLNPMRFSMGSTEAQPSLWQVGRCVTIAPGETLTERCWALLHTGDATVAWKAFHRFAHHEDFPPVAWTQEFKVHYYDFLSSAAGESGRRGGGYDADLPHFRDFRVGLATQHGYYPAIGDYIHPDRKTWQAMQGDRRGPATMSIELMRQRIRAAQATGAKAAIYIHSALFDDAATFFVRLQDVIQVNREGLPMEFGWAGPDSKGKAWRASLKDPQWQQHLLQQVQWIMEILHPDAITVDETFSGLGYDHHPVHAGPISTSAIEFYRKLRSLVRSFGSDKAVFTSDCSMSGFVMWADGEVGDHAYENLLGQPLYRQAPVRYLAALGDKPWRPCAWHSQKLWDLQMRFACQVGAGVGVSNGWLEYSGLAGLDSEMRERMTSDLRSLFDR